MSIEQIFAEKFNFFHSKKQNKTKFCLSSGGPRICGSKCMCDCLIMNKRQNTSLIHSQYHHQREIPRRFCLSSGGPRICGSKCMCDWLIKNKRQNTSLIHSQYHLQREIPRRWIPGIPVCDAMHAYLMGEALNLCQNIWTYFTKF